MFLQEVSAEVSARFLRDVSARGFCKRFLQEVCVRVSSRSCAFDLPGFCEVSAGFLRGLCRTAAAVTGLLWKAFRWTAAE